MAQVRNSGTFTGEALRRRRARLGVSQREASSTASLSPAAASKAEAGTPLTLRSFSRLAMALRLSPLEVWVIVANEGRP